MSEDEANDAWRWAVAFGHEAHVVCAQETPPSYVVVVREGSRTLEFRSRAAFGCWLDEEVRR